MKQIQKHWYLKDLTNIENEYLLHYFQIFIQS